MTAIHSEVSSSHVRARATDEKDCRTSVFVRLTQPSEHVLCWPLRSSLRILLEKLFDHSSNDVAWRYGIDPNAVLTPFGRKVSSELYHSGLGSIIGRTNQSLRRSAMDKSLFKMVTDSVGYGGAHGGYQGDASAIPKPNHLLSHGLRRHEYARDIDLKHQIGVSGRVL